MNQSISMIRKVLRIVGKHVMNSVHDIVYISGDFVVGEPFFGVKHKSMQDVFDDSPEKKASNHKRNSSK